MSETAKSINEVAEKIMETLRDLSLPAALTALEWAVASYAAHCSRSPEQEEEFADFFGDHVKRLLLEVRK